MSRALRVCSRGTFRYVDCDSRRRVDLMRDWLALQFENALPQDGRRRSPPLTGVALWRSAMAR